MPEARLLVERVDLHDHAVGLVLERVARLAPALDEGDDALDVEAGLAVRVDGQAEGAEAVEGLRLGGDRRRPGRLGGSGAVSGRRSAGGAVSGGRSAAPNSVACVGAASSSSW